VVAIVAIARSWRLSRSGRRRAASNRRRWLHRRGSLKLRPNTSARSAARAARPKWSAGTVLTIPPMEDGAATVSVVSRAPRSTTSACVGEPAAILRRQHEGADGTARDYEVAYTFGFDRSSKIWCARTVMQALSVAWDSRPPTLRQRWFDLNGDGATAGRRHWSRK
jgi:hypothetical protein